METVAGLQKTFEEKLAIALKYKAEGNDWVKQQKWREALGCYHRGYLYVKGFEMSNEFGGTLGAVAQATGASSVSEEKKKEAKALSIAILSNMALCHMKLEAWQKVVDDCNKVLGFDEKSAKALYRRGVAYIHLRDLDRAEADLTKAAVLDPADPAIKSELKKVKHLQALEDQKQKKLYSGFLNKMFEEEKKLTTGEASKQPEAPPPAPEKITPSVEEVVDEKK